MGTIGKLSSANKCLYPIFASFYQCSSLECTPGHFAIWRIATFSSHIGAITARGLLFRFSMDLGILVFHETW